MQRTAKQMRFLKQKSDLCIATRYFTQNIPYAVIKEKRGKVTSIKEKPEVNFQINSGIYVLNNRSNPNKIN